MSGPTPARESMRGQGRDLLLAAAKEVFAEKGFARAGIREIAARAGVAEPNIYWHFKSKRGLFEAAVTEPFANFVDDFFGAWQKRSPGKRPALDEAVDYLTGLYEVLHAERDLLLAVLADRQFSGHNSSATSALHSTVTDLLALHENLLRAETSRRGYRELDLPNWTRIFFATIFTLAVHGELLGVEAPTHVQNVIRDFAEMSIYGAYETDRGRAARRVPRRAGGRSR